MKLRTNPYVIRIYSGKRKDHIEESYSEMLLFSQWRDEKKTFFNNDEDFRRLVREMFKTENDGNSNDEPVEENSDDEPVEENSDDELLDDEKFQTKVQELTRKGLFRKRGSEVEKNRKRIYPHSQRIQELRKLLEEEEILRNTKMDNELDPNAEQKDADDAENQSEDGTTDEMGDPSEEFPKYSKPPYAKNKKGTPPKQEECKFKLPILDDIETMKSKVLTLSYEQRCVFDKYIDFCKRVMCSVRYGGNVDTNPPKLIVHGGGGVGKSYLIQLLSQWVHYILSSWGDISLYPKLTRFAYTGAAAFLIGMNTIEIIKPQFQNMY